ncbi:MAG: hypothetical protein J6I96_06190 [Oscillospiraceae bacterium]|nr:hypothetical protein [Oscillospiraceae bacterium]
MKRYLIILSLALLTSCQAQGAVTEEQVTAAESEQTTAPPVVTMATTRANTTVLEGYYLKGRDCDFIITETGPIQLIGEQVSFTGVTNGDTISVESGDVLLSWPGVAETKSVSKLADGEITDIPRNHLNSLAGCGWVEYYEKTGLYIRGKDGSDLITTGDDNVVMMLTNEDPALKGFENGQRIRIGYANVTSGDPPQVAQYFAEKFSDNAPDEIPQDVMDYLVKKGYADEPVVTESETEPADTELTEETTEMTTVTETEPVTEQTTAEVVSELMVYEGYYLNKNGVRMVIDPSAFPIVLLNDDPVFSDLTDGDIIWVETDVVMESYPGQTYQFSVTKLSDGVYEDIPADIIASLE